MDFILRMGFIFWYHLPALTWALLRLCGRYRNISKANARLLTASGLAETVPVCLSPRICPLSCSGCSQKDLWKTETEMPPLAVSVLEVTFILLHHGTRRTRIFHSAEFDIFSFAMTERTRGSNLWARLGQPNPALRKGMDNPVWVFFFF